VTIPCSVSALKNDSNNNNHTTTTTTTTATPTATTTFCSSTWGKAVKHNLKPSWIRREQTRVSNVTAMEHSPITTEKVSRLNAKKLNRKAPGPDGISNFWIKQFTATLT